MSERFAREVLHILMMMTNIDKMAGGGGGKSKYDNFMSKRSGI